MAVKGREEIKSSGLGFLGLAAILIFVIGYNIFYRTVVDKIPDYTTRTMIGVAALLLMVVLFIFVLRYVATRYFLVLTHKNFTIDQKLLFFNRQVVNIPVSAMVRVMPADAFSGVSGKKKSVVLSRVEDKGNYVIIYREGKSENAVKFQCSAKLYKSLQELIKPPVTSQNKNGGNQNSQQKKKKK